MIDTGENYFKLSYQSNLQEQKKIMQSADQPTGCQKTLGKGIFIFAILPIIGLYFMMSKGLTWSGIQLPWYVMLLGYVMLLVLLWIIFWVLLSKWILGKCEPKAGPVIEGEKEREIKEEINDVEVLLGEKEIVWYWIDDERSVKYNEISLLVIVDQGIVIYTKENKRTLLHSIKTKGLSTDPKKQITKFFKSKSNEDQIFKLISIPLPMNQ